MKNQQPKAIWLMSAFWFIMGATQILLDAAHWIGWGKGGNDEFFNISLILYIILRRIELEVGSGNSFPQFFSNN